MEIDCGRCQMRGTGCHDCVVTVLDPAKPAKGVRFPANSPGFLPEAEVKALGVLAEAGLVPPLRLSLTVTFDPAVRARPRLDPEGLPRHQSLVMLA